jgi:cadmium resistance protein CadD (predicted permease)
LSCLLYNPSVKHPLHKEEKVSENKVFLQGFILAMLGYVIMLVISVLVLRNVGQPYVRLLVTLLPMIPIWFGLKAVMGAVRSMDEFQQRIQLEAVGFAFGATALLTFGYAVLVSAGFPELSFFWVMPVMMVLWGLGQWLAQRKYQ